MLTLAGCLLLDNQGRLLLLHRHTPKLTQWELPGGKIDEGEDPATAAAREVQEELGVLVVITGELGGRRFTENGHTMHYTWFMANITSGTPRPMEEKYDDVRFFSWDELASRGDLSPNLRNLLDARAEGLLGHFASRERRTRNEVIIETQNRKIKKMAERVLDHEAKADLALTFACECADRDCGQTLQLSADEYALTHQRVDHFIIWPGHEQADIERVVGCYPNNDNPKYCIVEKYAIGGDIVTDLL